MAYIEIGLREPLVCLHGSLCDFRIWSSGRFRIATVWWF
jgi:hypothetical protein